MKKEFRSFLEMGYKEREFFSKNETKLVPHLENDFIGIYGNDDEGYVTAYCDSVTGGIVEEDIFYEDGSKVHVEDLEI